MPAVKNTRKFNQSKKMLKLAALNYFILHYIDSCADAIGALRFDDLFGHAPFKPDWVCLEPEEKELTS